MSVAFDHPLFESKKMLRVRAIAAFNNTCQHCHGEGDETTGPDGRPWHLDRIKPGALGGQYESFNVTLMCATCNCSKGDTFSRQFYDMYQDLETREHDIEWDRHIELKEEDRDQRAYYLKLDMGKPANGNTPWVELFPWA